MAAGERPTSRRVLAQVLDTPRQVADHPKQDVHRRSLNVPPASAGANGYTVMRATVSGGPYATVGIPAATTFTNAGLNTGTTYFYVVRARNAAGSSANSPEVSATAL